MTSRSSWIRNTPTPAAALIVDGIFLHRPELRACWDLSIFLKVDFDVSLPRGAARGPSFDAIDPDSPPHQRYVGGQRRYLAECDPEQQADIVIDYNDLQDTDGFEVDDQRSLDGAQRNPGEAVIRGQTMSGLRLRSIRATGSTCSSAAPACAIPRRRPRTRRAPAAAGGGSGNTETVPETARTSRRAR